DRRASAPAEPRVAVGSSRMPRRKRIEYLARAATEFGFVPIGWRYGDGDDGVRRHDLCERGTQGYTLDRGSELIGQQPRGLEHGGHLFALVDWQKNALHGIPPGCCGRRQA